MRPITLCLLCSLLITPAVMTMHGPPDLDDFFGNPTVSSQNSPVVPSAKKEESEAKLDASKAGRAKSWSAIAQQQEALSEGITRLSRMLDKFLTPRNNDNR